MDKVKINATIEWAFLNQPNDMSGKYQVDLCNLSQKAVSALQELGLVAHQRDDKPEKGYYITCKSARPIKAFDDFGAGIPQDTLVGNGSKATAVVGFYEWTFKAKKGRSPSLVKLVVTDLKTYDGGDSGVVSVDGDDDDIL